MLWSYSNSPCLPAPAERWFAWNLSVIDDHRITDEMKRKSQDSLAVRAFPAASLAGAYGVASESLAPQPAFQPKSRVAAPDKHPQYPVSNPELLTGRAIPAAAQAGVHGVPAAYTAAKPSTPPQRRVSPPAKTRRYRTGSARFQGREGFPAASYFGIYLASARLVSNMPSTSSSLVKDRYANGNRAL